MRFQGDVNISMADAVGPTKSAAKTAKTDASKVSKKKPDPEGLKLIEEGDKAMEAKDFGKAIELYNAGQKACESSAVQATAKPKPAKEPKESKPNAAAGQPAPEEVKE